MIRHVIMWRFKDEYEGMDKDAIMDKVTAMFTELKKVIPEIRFMSVERDVLRSERSYDMIYITEFDSLETLEIYRVHPEHVKVAAFIQQIRVAQSVTDTEKSEIR
ncbi:MAG: Dabb family protein [Clostridia bacterium]|nr:Dabb family protein [Clostridia bacterium]